MNCHFRHKWVILNTRMTFRWMSEQYFVAYSVLKNNLCLNSHLLNSSSKDFIIAYDQWMSF